MNYRNTRRQVVTIVAVFALAGAVSVSGAAGDWPRFGGPEGTHMLNGSAWNPDALKAGAKVLWQKPIGAGYSSVSAVGGSVYASGYRGGSDTIFCLNAATGAEVWKHTYACKPFGGSEGPCATPTVDADRVYTFSQQGHVFCLTADKGEVKWTRNVTTDLKAVPPKWGFAGSAVVHGNMLLVNAGDSGIAFDKTSGAVLWSSEGVGGYSTPVVCELGGKKCVVLFSEQTLVVVEAASGKKLMSLPWKTSWLVNASDPVLMPDGKFFITSGYGRGCALVDPAGGNLKIVWENKELSSHFGSPILIGGLIYGVHGQTGGGSVRCVDPGTGAVKWTGETGFGAMIAADKKLIFLQADGNLRVAEADPTGYKELVKAPVFTSKVKCWTAPVLANGKVYCRASGGDLACVDVGK